MFGNLDDCSTCKGWSGTVVSAGTVGKIGVTDKFSCDRPDGVSCGTERTEVKSFGMKKRTDSSPETETAVKSKIDTQNTKWKFSVSREIENHFLGVAVLIWLTLHGPPVRGDRDRTNRAFLGERSGFVSKV